MVGGTHTSKIEQTLNTTRYTVYLYTLYCIGALMKSGSNNELIESLRKKKVGIDNRINKNTIGLGTVTAKVDESSGKKKVFKKRITGGVTTSTSLG